LLFPNRWTALAFALNTLTWLGRFILRIGLDAPQATFLPRPM